MRGRSWGLRSYQYSAPQVREPSIPGCRGDQIAVRDAVFKLVNNPYRDLPGLILTGLALSQQHGLAVL